MCRRKFENRLTNEDLTPKNVLNRGFCIDKGDNPNIFNFGFLQICRLYSNIWVPAKHV